MKENPYTSRQMHQVLALEQFLTCMKWCELHDRWNTGWCNPVFYIISSKSLSSAEIQYNNIEWETLGILHGLEKFNQSSLLEK